MCIRDRSFTAQERADFLRRVTGHIPNVKVDVYTGLLAEYAHNVGACTIIKGLRAVTDFDDLSLIHICRAW